MYANTKMNRIHTLWNERQKALSEEYKWLSVQSQDEQQTDVLQ